MILALAVALVLLWTPLGEAATRYISPTGSNSNNGQSTGTPWLTWAHAFSNTACGDTLLVMDGTFTPATHGNPSLTKACTQDSPYTVQSVNSRTPLINGNAGGIAFRVLNSTYVVLDGLRIKSADVSSNPSGSVVEISNGNHVTVKNGIFYENNRYGNNHVVAFVDSPFGLVEGNEIYTYHRHGIFFHDSDNGVARRNYCNARGRGNLAGGVPNSGFDADGCVTAYPGDNMVFENNFSEGNILAAVTLRALGSTTNNLVVGNGSIGAFVGMRVVSAGSGLSNTPRDNTLRHNVSIAATGSGVRIDGARNTTCDQCSSIGGAGGLFVTTSGPGDGVYSFFATKPLVFGGSGIGVQIQSGVQTWTITNADSYNNTGGNYSPSSSANYTPSNPPSAVDPQMGSCYLWAPDGSTAKTNGWGATILYRYVDGALTVEPLWDTVTGEFPHGAIITGVNDTATTSAYNMHQRFRVNTGGCSFPASYVGTPPAGPATYETSEGTTSTTHDHVIDGGRAGLLACVTLWKSGGSVGSVNAVSSGGQALSLLGAVTSQNGIRRAELWAVLSPTSGTRSIAVTTTGSVDGVITTSIEVDNVLSWGTPATGIANGTAVTATASTANDEVIYDCLASGKTFLLSTGPDQTSQVQEDHNTQALRLATGTQLGSAGGLIEYFNSGVTDFALVAVSAAPDGSPGGGTGTRTLSKYQMACGRGAESSTCVLAAHDTSATIVSGGMVRIKAEISGGTATTDEWGARWYCRVGAGSYARVMDTYGANQFRFVGGGADSTIPSSLTDIVTPFSGTNYVTGKIVRSDQSVMILPAMTSTQHTETWAVIEVTGTPGEQIQCRPQLDSGALLDAYTVTPTITIAAPHAEAP